MMSCFACQENQIALCLTLFMSYNYCAFNYVDIIVILFYNHDPNLSNIIIAYYLIYLSS